MPPAVLTIGHSNHPPERFLALLARHEVEALADIRRFPGSRKHPHFNRDNLAAALPKSGVEYHWLEALGGRRHKQQGESPNVGLENEGLFWQCHRRLVSDFLAANGVTVLHIMPGGELRPHTLTSGAVIDNGRVTYPGEKSLFT